MRGDWRDHGEGPILGTPVSSGPERMVWETKMAPGGGHKSH